jgi:FKBP-type peptidyl-prolyl cis-trans isomerase FklB
MDKVSYALGLGIGQQLKSMGANDLCIDDFAQAIKDVIDNKELVVSHHEAQSIVTKYFQEKEAEMNNLLALKGE